MARAVSFFFAFGPDSRSLPQVKLTSGTDDKADDTEKHFRNSRNGISCRGTWKPDSVRPLIQEDHLLRPRSCRLCGITRLANYFWRRQFAWSMSIRKTPGDSACLKKSMSEFRACRLINSRISLLQYQRGLANNPLAATAEIRDQRADSPRGKTRGVQRTGDASTGKVLQAQPQLKAQNSPSRTPPTCCKREFRGGSQAKAARLGQSGRPLMDCRLPADYFIGQQAVVFSFDNRITLAYPHFQSGTIQNGNTATVVFD